MGLMKYIHDLITDMTMSQIGLGVSRFGTKVSEEASFELLDFFHKNGGNVIDTARNYYEWVEGGRGKSEECIGKWMDIRRKRAEIIISTKGGVKGSGTNKMVDLSYASLRDEIDQSMDALRTNYIDIYFLHRDDINEPVEKIVENVQKIKEIAKIKLIGVSNWSFERIRRANNYAMEQGLQPFRIVQTWWSLAEYTSQMWDDENSTYMTTDLYKYMLDNNLFGMAYTSQCKGYFQKAIKYGIENVDSFLRYRIETERNLKKLEFIKTYCELNAISPTAFVNGYITSNRLQGIALVSCSNIQQLADIINNSDFNLSLNAIDKIDEI